MDCCKLEKTVMAISYEILFGTKCCKLLDAVLRVLVTFTAMSMGTVAQTVLCTQHSKRFIQMIWDSRRMEIQRLGALSRT